MLTKHTITIDGQKIIYQTSGEGYPVVLVHGLSASSLWWGKNIDELSQHYKLYLVDLPGYGTMRKHRKTFELKTAASWLIKWMIAVDIEKAHFIGNSMGGYICTQVAVQDPKLVNKLILVAPIGFPLGRTIITSLFALAQALRYMVPSFYPILIMDALRTGIRMIFSTTKSILSLNAEEELKHILAPTLLIWGENDKLVPTLHAALFRKIIPHSKLVIIKKAGHVPMFDSPQVFNKAALTFLVA